MKIQGRFDCKTAVALFLWFSTMAAESDEIRWRLPFNPKRGSVSDSTLQFNKVATQFHSQFNDELEIRAHHFGEDWNGLSGTDTDPKSDVGVPVFTISSGIQKIHSADPNSSVEIVHRLPGGLTVVSVLRHLQNVRSKDTNVIPYENLDEVLAEIGDLEKWPHLHVEISTLSESRHFLRNPYHGGVREDGRLRELLTFRSLLTWYSPTVLVSDRAFTVSQFVPNVSLDVWPNYFAPLDYEASEITLGPVTSEGAMYVEYRSVGDGPSSLSFLEVETGGVMVQHSLEQAVSNGLVGSFIVSFTSVDWRYEAVESLIFRKGRRYLFVLNELPATVHFGVPMDLLDYDRWPDHMKWNNDDGTQWRSGVSRGRAAMDMVYALRNSDHFFGVWYGSDVFEVEMHIPEISTDYMVHARPFETIRAFRRGKEGNNAGELSKWDWVFHLTHREFPWVRLVGYERHGVFGGWSFVDPNDLQIANEFNGQNKAMIHSRLESVQLDELMRLHGIEKPTGAISSRSLHLEDPASGSELHLEAFSGIRRSMVFLPGNDVVHPVDILDLLQEPGLRSSKLENLPLVSPSNVSYGIVTDGPYVDGEDSFLATDQRQIRWQVVWYDESDCEIATGWVEGDKLELLGEVGSLEEIIRSRDSACSDALFNDEAPVGPVSGPPRIRVDLAVASAESGDELPHGIGGGPEAIYPLETEGGEIESSLSQNTESNTESVDVNLHEGTIAVRPPDSEDSASELTVPQQHAITTYRLQRVNESFFAWRYRERNTRAPIADAIPAGSYIYEAPVGSPLNLNDTADWVHVLVYDLYGNSRYDAAYPHGLEFAPIATEVHDRLSDGDVDAYARGLVEHERSLLVEFDENAPSMPLELTLIDTNTIEVEGVRKARMKMIVDRDVFAGLGYDGSPQGATALRGSGSVVIGPSLYCQPGEDSASWSFWVKTDRVAQAPGGALSIMRMMDEESGYEIVMHMDGSEKSGTVGIVLKSDGEIADMVQNSRPLNDGNYHFVAVNLHRYLNAEYRLELIVDGALVSRREGTGVLKLYPQDPVRIGQGFDGLLDDCSFSLGKTMTTEHAEDVFRAAQSYIIPVWITNLEAHPEFRHSGSGFAPGSNSFTMVVCLSQGPASGDGIIPYYTATSRPSDEEGRNSVKVFSRLHPDPDDAVNGILGELIWGTENGSGGTTLTVGGPAISDRQQHCAVIVAQNLGARATLTLYLDGVKRSEVQHPSEAYDIPALGWGWQVGRFLDSDYGSSRFTADHTNTAIQNVYLIADAVAAQDVLAHHVYRTEGVLPADFESFREQKDNADDQMDPRLDPGVGNQPSPASDPNPTDETLPAADPESQSDPAGGTDSMDSSELPGCVDFQVTQIEGAEVENGILIADSGYAIVRLARDFRPEVNPFSISGSFATDSARNQMIVAMVAQMDRGEYLSVEMNSQRLVATVNPAGVRSTIERDFSDGEVHRFSVELSNAAEKRILLMVDGEEGELSGNTQQTYNFSNGYEWIVGALRGFENEIGGKFEGVIDLENLCIDPR